jgi:hypothetical protein
MAIKQIFWGEIVVKLLYRPLIIGLSVLVLAILGCSGGVGSISGKLTYKGQPIPNATITFFTDQGMPFPVISGSDGTYTISNIPVGEVLVSVAAPPPANTESGSREKDAAARAAAPKAADTPSYTLPTAYADPGSSELKIAVHSGNNLFDILLIDK